MTTFLGAIGVPHYTKDGKLYTGEMHKDASGRLMTGKFHTANSQFLFHSKSGIGAIGTNDIEIISVNYFGDVGDKNSGVYGENFNTKVHYKKYGKSYLATLYIDYFHGDVFIPKQPKGYKALRGLTTAVRQKEKLRTR